MNKQEEQIIIENVISGNSQAFTVLVDAYKDMAVLLAYNILLNQEDAEEAAQDAFVKAYSSLYSFKGGSKFSTWLYRIIVNTALNKKKLKKYRTLEITPSLDNQFSSPGLSIPATQTAIEQRKHIQLGLRSINDNERLCITLFYLNELSVEEINELTGLTISNIKVLLYRGRKNLYAALQQHLKFEMKNLI